MCDRPGSLRDSKLSQTTIGVLYPGELGSTFAKLLVESGFRVVTTLEGRSLRTRKLCHDAGLNVLDSVGQVLKCAPIVISVVPPGAALQVAENVAVLVKGESRRLLYVDANSISPLTAVKISDLLSQQDVDFVDASIRGLASQLRQAGILFLSGARAVDLSDQFGSIMRVKVVGDAPGQASALKMVLSCLPKGLIGLFSETMLFAREMGLLDEAMEICEEFYPGVMEVVERMLPTYPQHAARRSGRSRRQTITLTTWRSKSFKLVGLDGFCLYLLSERRAGVGLKVSILSDKGGPRHGHDFALSGHS